MTKRDKKTVALAVKVARIHERHDSAAFQPRRVVSLLAQAVILLAGEQP